MQEEMISQKKRILFRKSLSEEQKFTLLREILDSSSHIVFLGGAGVSTESGIPDFRSKNGLTHNYHGKHLIIINKGKTKMEGKADIVLHDSIGKILDHVHT